MNHFRRDRIRRPLISGAMYFLACGVLAHTVVAPSAEQKRAKDTSPDPKSDPTYVEIATTPRENLFRVSGVVTDSKGKPVPDARIGIGYSWHARIEEFRDDHSFQNSQTRSDGTFEFGIPTPWIRFVSAEKDGQEASAGEFDEPLLKPGRFELRLKKE